MSISYNKKDLLILLVKGTHRCNMNCTYCYDRIAREKVKEEMTLEMVRELAEKSLYAAHKISWIWHGGEILCMGLEWFKAANEIVKEVLGDCLTRIGFQSNGILVNKEYIEYFKTEPLLNFGISFDGIDHDELRGKNGELIKQHILDAKEAGLKFSVISVLSQATASHWKENIELFKSLGEYNVSFNWIHPHEIVEENNVYSSLDQYIQDVKDMIDYLLYDQDGFSERVLEALITNIFGRRDCVCTYSGCLGRYLSVSPNGNFYPCDRWYPERYNLGNLKDFDSITDAFLSDGYTRLIQDRSDRRTYCMENCELFEHCAGGCNANAILTGDGVANVVDPAWCRVYKEAFWHTFNRIKDLTDEDFEKLNPSVRRVLYRMNYVSLSSIKECLRQQKQEER